METVGLGAFCIWAVTQFAKLAEVLVRAAMR